MPYYLYIHNIHLYQYHDTKPNLINIDWLLGLTPTAVAKLTASLSPRAMLRSRLLVTSGRLFRHPRSKPAPAKIY